MPDADWWQALWPDPEGVLRALGIGFGMSVLDLCCGDGHFTHKIAHIVGGVGRTTALDIDPEVLVQAKDRAARAGLPPTSIRWLECDASNLIDKLPSQPEYILLSNTFHGVPDKVKMARNVFEVLKPEGQFAIINWHHRSRDDTIVLGEPRGPETKLRLTPEQVMDVVLPVGFKLHGVVELPPYHYGIVFEKPKTG